MRHNFETMACVFCLLLVLTGRQLVQQHGMSDSFHVCGSMVRGYKDASVSQYANFSGSNTHTVWQEGPNLCAHHSTRPNGSVHRLKEGLQWQANYQTCTDFQLHEQ